MAVNMRLTASDETGAAVASAEGRLKKYGAAAGKTDQDLARMRSSVSATSSSVNALGRILRGDVTAFDELGAAMGRTSLAAAKMGAVIAAAGAGWQVGKQLNEAFAISTRIAALLNGVDPSSVRTFADLTEKAVKDSNAAAERIKSLRNANTEARVAEIERDTPEGPARTFGVARERGQAQLAEIKSEVESAFLALENAKRKLAVEEKSANTDKSEAQLKRIAAANDDVARASLSAQNAMAIGDAKRAAVNAGLDQVYNDAAKAADKLRDSIAKAQLDREMTDFRNASAAAGRELEKIDRVMKGIGDKRLAGLARDVMGGKAPATALDKAANNLAIRDAFAGERAQRLSPEGKAAAREVEKERDRFDNELKRAQARNAQGRKLTTREKELLQEWEFGGAGKQGAKEDQRVQLDNITQRNLDEIKLSSQTTAKAMTELNKSLTALLIASGQ